MWVCLLHLDPGDRRSSRAHKFGHRVGLDHEQVLVPNLDTTTGGPVVAQPSTQTIDRQIPALFAPVFDIGQRASRECAHAPPALPLTAVIAASMAADCCASGVPSARLLRSVKFLRQLFVLQFAEGLQLHHHHDRVFHLRASQPLFLGILTDAGTLYLS